MTEQSDVFFNKLYAIQPFKETISPRSSQKLVVEEEGNVGQNLSEVCNAPEMPQFMEEMEPLKKINSQQPVLHDHQFGEANRKTMTSISSTIDILFEKIQKIKQEFSFALERPNLQSEISSEPILQGVHSQMESKDCYDKENKIPPERLTHSKSKPVEISEQYQSSRPLEVHKNNQANYQSQNFNVFSLNMFKPWAEEDTQSEGLRIRDFQLGKCIGSGKFGDVFICQHKATGFLCAIKKILKSTIQEYKMVDQFSSQLKIHYTLDHPNVINIYSHFQDEYHIFLLMELAPQGSLIQKLSMAEMETSRMVDQITDGLVHIHRNKIIHRDLKPQNVVLVLGVPKICDFGWAAINQNIMHQTFCGTLDYVSPQMKDTGEYNESIDLWSIGVLTFQLLAGFPPFKQEISNWKLKGSKRTVKWSWEILFPPQIENQAQKFIESLLQVDPTQRASLVEVKSSPFLTIYRNEQQFPQLEKQQLQTLFQ